MTPGDYSEDALVEQPAIALFGALGWEAANCFHEQYGPGGTLGRETKGEVVLAYQHVYEAYFGEGRSIYPAA
jgi:type I restriction enzyme R subunit